MKKIILYRLIAFVALCFMSIVIKSETVLCKFFYGSIHENLRTLEVKKAEDGINNIDYKSEPFIIKI